jgi:SAM-dependent methyltransferase
MSREIKDQTLFDEIAEKYMRKDIALSSMLPRKAQIVTAIQPFLEKEATLGTVMDIGCGIGAPAKYLSGSYDRYIGIDQSGEMIAIAQHFNQEEKLAEFIADNIKSPTIPKKAADMVLSIGALHHMNELEKVMEALVELAKPEADLVVIEPQNGNPLIQAMRWIRGKIDKGYSEEQIFFSETELVELLTNAGITDLVINYQGYLSTPFAQVIIPPQFLTSKLSKIVIKIDGWLQAHMKGWARKLSFNIIITGKFPSG